MFHRRRRVVRLGSKRPPVSVPLVTWQEVALPPRGAALVVPGTPSGTVVVVAGDRLGVQLAAALVPGPGQWGGVHRVLRDLEVDGEVGVSIGRHGRRYAVVHVWSLDATRTTIGVWVVHALGRAVLAECPEAW
jgi:hypothetical protein